MYITRCRKDVSQQTKESAFGFRMVDRVRWTYLMARWVTSLRQRVMCVFPSKSTILAKLLSPCCPCCSPRPPTAPLRVSPPSARSRSASQTVARAVEGKSEQLRHSGVCNNNQQSQELRFDCSRMDSLHGLRVAALYPRPARMGSLELGLISRRR